MNSILTYYFLIGVVVWYIVKEYLDLVPYNRAIALSIILVWPMWVMAITFLLLAKINELLGNRFKD